MNMKSLQIVLKIRSTIEVPKFPVHLDGLLFWALYELGEDTEKLKEILKQTEGIYHASAMRYIRSPIMPITTAPVVNVTTSKWPDFPYPLFQKVVSANGLIKTKAVSRIVFKTGPYRRKISVRNGVSVGEVEFHAVGDAKKIKWLLDSLGFIGLSNRKGYGEIEEIIINEIDEDHSWFDENGYLARILPVEKMLQSDISGYVQQLCRFAPNYADIKTPSVLCCLPNYRLKTIY